jgi:hypothetical protein
MKENPDIDELLNAYIDEELTPRQRIEIRRLVSHDPQIARRLRELEKCKMLVASLPFNEAPAEMLEDVKASLGKKIFLEQRFADIDRQAGAMHLMVRRVLSAAAMIGLVAILTAVIYTIVSPESAPQKPVALETPKQPVKKLETAKPAPGPVATAEKPVSKPAAEPAFNSKLELKTKAFVAVDAFIKRAIEDNGLLEYSGPRSQLGKGVHAFSCDRRAFSLLLADLENIWARCDSARLFVETGRANEEVMVNLANAEQIAKIINQDNLENRVKVAKDFAALNNVTAFLPGKEMLATVDSEKPDFMTIPKPVLTSSEKTTKKPPALTQDDQKIHLAIVVVSSQ